MSAIAGLGDELAKIRVYIGNRPSYHLTYGQGHLGLAPLTQSHSQQVNSELGPILALKPGEIKAIGLACGNGWRKVFNVYAKLLYALGKSGLNIIDKHRFTSWQTYRDEQLLQTGSNTALWFEPYQARPAAQGSLNLIMGRTYAKSLNLPTNLLWLDTEFAIAPEFNIIVCPYFDYRQLSNIKIIRLVELIEEFSNGRY
jgi:hypothetical protein